MAAGMAIVAGVQAIGAIKGYRDQKKAAKQQRGVDLQNIERQKKEGAEQIRRTGDQQKLVESQGQVAVGASGFAKGSSADKYLESVAGVHKTELDWLKGSVKSGVDIAGRESATRYDINRRSANTGLIQGLGSAAGTAVSSVGQFKKTGNWWSV